MSLPELPNEVTSWEQVADYLTRLKSYLLNTNDPNEASANGRTCVAHAIGLCNTEEGIVILKSLLGKGGNPNLPSPFDNFQNYNMVAKSIEPLELLISAGLELNHVYTAEPGFLFTGDRPFTILDFAIDIQARLNKNRKSWSSLAKKYAGGIGSRRRFIDDTVTLLESHGAKHAADVLTP